MGKASKAYDDGKTHRCADKPWLQKKSKTTKVRAKAQRQIALARLLPSFSYPLVFVPVLTPTGLFWIPKKQFWNPKRPFWSLKSSFRTPKRLFWNPKRPVRSPKRSFQSPKLLFRTRNDHFGVRNGHFGFRKGYASTKVRKSQF